MIEILLNDCVGCFSLSEKAEEIINEKSPGLLKFKKESWFRNNEVVKDVVKDLGDEANGKNSKIIVSAIPDGTRWAISGDGGIETIYVLGDEIKVYDDE